MEREIKRLQDDEPVTFRKPDPFDRFDDWAVVAASSCGLGQCPEKMLATVALG